jgi:hypothetical protein
MNQEYASNESINQYFDCCFCDELTDIKDMITSCDICREEFSSCNNCVRSFKRFILTRYGVCTRCVTNIKSSMYRHDSDKDIGGVIVDSPRSCTGCKLSDSDTNRCYLCLYYHCINCAIRLISIERLKKNKNTKERLICLSCADYVISNFFIV